MTEPAGGHKPLRPLKIKYSFLKILTGSDLSTRRLPLMEAVSVNPGPVVWLTGCIHGDEVGGIVVIQEVFRKLRKAPLLKGSLHAFPLMNPIGFETMSRNITVSKEDLNRSFPGNRNGSLAERIADRIFTTIRETNPALILDLHNDWRKSIPYTLIDPEPGPSNRETFEKVKCFSEKAGFLIIGEQMDASYTADLSKTLTYSLIQHGIPALTLELGESYVVNEINVEDGVKSIWNILAHMEMVSAPDAVFNYRLPEEMKGKILRYSHLPVSSTSGIIRFLVKPGDIIKSGQPVAKIFNTFGELMETINSQQDSIVLGYSDSSVAFPGGPVMAFGIL